MMIFGITNNRGFFPQAFAASGVNIVAVGDWGCTGNTQQTVNNTKGKNPQLVLALGDYSYEKTGTCWFNETKSIASITKINIGNHDDENDALLNSYLKHFGLSGQYYSFNIQNVHVLTMSTEQASRSGSKQYNFVINDLEQASADPKIKWIVVSLHAPLYSSPNTCAESTCAGDKTFRDAYHKLFDQYGVDMVLEGHVHNYQRSFPIKYNLLDPPNPIVTSSSKNSYKNLAGEIYAIVGTGGVNLNGLSGKSSFIASQQDSKFGVLEMQFSNSKLDAKFIANGGLVLDHFSITKTIKKTVSPTPTLTPTITTPEIVPKAVDKKSQDSQKVKNTTKLNENEPANDKSVKKTQKTSNANETKSTVSKDKIKTEKTKAHKNNQNPVLSSGTNLLQPPEENNKSTASGSEVSNPSKGNEIGIKNNVSSSQPSNPFAPLTPFP